MCIPFHRPHAQHVDACMRPKMLLGLEETFVLLDVAKSNCSIIDCLVQLQYFCHSVLILEEKLEVINVLHPGNPYWMVLVRNEMLK